MKTPCRRIYKWPRSQTRESQYPVPSGPGTIWRHPWNVAEAPDHPRADFVTIRTYGTWLSGDPRGSVDSDHRGDGEPFAPRDDFPRNYQRRHLKAEPFLINAQARAEIERAMVDLSEFRGWELLAVNVRTNHMHVVVSAGQSAEKVMGNLKAYATRALRQAGLVDNGRPIWARHGSTRYAWNEHQAWRCVVYTLEQQGDDLPGSGWSRARIAWLKGGVPPGPRGTEY